MSHMHSNRTITSDEGPMYPRPSDPHFQCTLSRKEAIPWIKLAIFVTASKAGIYAVGRFMAKAGVPRGFDFYPQRKRVTHLAAFFDENLPSWTTPQHDESNDANALTRTAGMIAKSMSTGPFPPHVFKRVAAPPVPFDATFTDERVKYWVEAISRALKFIPPSLFEDLKIWHRPSDLPDDRVLAYVYFNHPRRGLCKGIVEVDCQLRLQPSGKEEWVPDVGVHTGGSVLGSDIILSLPTGKKIRTLAYPYHLFQGPNCKNPTMAVVLKFSGKDKARYDNVAAADADALRLGMEIFFGLSAPPKPNV